MRKVYNSVNNMSRKLHRIMGIDPGFGRVGVAVIEGDGENWKAVWYGCIETNPKKTMPERLEEINRELAKIINTYKPSRACVEKLFFNTNVTTGIQVGEARGVIMLTIIQAGIPVSEFTPLQVKQTITGYGRAEKKQIQMMVRTLLHLNTKKIQDDAADALAVALTCGAVDK